MGKIRIFKMNDYDWFAAESLEEAQGAMIRFFGPPTSSQSVEEFLDEMQDNPHEVADEALDVLEFREDEDGDDSDKGKTFRQKLAEMIAAGEKFLTHFASTEG